MVMGNGNEIYLTTQQENKTSAIWERVEKQAPHPPLKVIFVTFKIIKYYFINVWEKNRNGRIIKVTNVTTIQ